MIRVFGHYISRIFIGLGAVEFAVLWLSLLAGYYIRIEARLEELVVPFSTISALAVGYAAITVLAMIAVGLYQRGLPWGAGFVLRILMAFGISFTATVLLFYAVPHVTLGRGVVGLTLLFSLVGVLSVRSLFLRFAGSDVFHHRVLVLGVGRHAATIQDLEGTDQLFRVVGFVNLGDPEELVPPARQVRLESSLVDLMVARDADELVVAVDDRRKRLPVDEILDCMAVTGEADYILRIVAPDLDAFARFITDRLIEPSRYQQVSQELRFTGGAPDAKLKLQQPFTIADPAFIVDEASAQLTGWLSNADEVTYTEVSINAIAYNAKGEIVGGGSGYMEFVPSKDTIGVSVPATVTEAPTRVEIYPSLSAYSASLPGGKWWNNIKVEDWSFVTTSSGQLAGGAVLTNITDRVLTGTFYILEKIVDKSSNRYGKIVDAEGEIVNGDADVLLDTVPEGGQFIGAPMRYWMRLTNDGVGHHIGPVRRYPASHACVRGPSGTIPTVYSKVKEGTRVVIE